MFSIEQLSDLSQSIAAHDEKYDCRVRSSTSKRVLNEAKEAGLKRGVTVPLFGPFGQLSLVSFASRFDDVDPQYRLSRFNALAWQFHHAFTEIAPSSKGKCHMQVVLSEREKDCLRWVGEGNHPGKSESS